MGFWTSIFFLLCFVGTVVFYWQRLFAAKAGRAWRWLLFWFGKGVAFPVLVWVLVNLGILPFIPPFIPELEGIRAAGGDWVAALLEATGAVLWAIGSCWSAVTFAWLAISLIWGAEDRKDALAVFVSWSLLSFSVGLVLLFWLGWPGLGLAATLWLAPAVHHLAPLREVEPLAPTYYRAMAKMKFGKYNEAEWEVISELEKCQDDFEGWMMLAELYALHFGDLAGADRTVHEVCSQPGATVSQIAVALHRLADWHLKAGEDPVAARRVLEEICQRMPGSHLDKMARQRIGQLPASSEELRERRRGKTFRLPGLSDEFEAASDQREPEMPREAAGARANQCVEKLQQNPDDVPAREELAKLLAERLAKVDLALEQLELLLNMPDPPPAKAAEWLSVMAAWQFKHRHDNVAAKALLMRLIREFPQTPQAFDAQRRINFMDVEQRMREARSAASSRTVRLD